MHVTFSTRQRSLSKYAIDFIQTKMIVLAAFIHTYLLPPVSIAQYSLTPLTDPEQYSVKELAECFVVYVYSVRQGSINELVYNIYAFISPL